MPLARYLPALALAVCVPAASATGPADETLSIARGRCEPAAARSGSNLAGFSGGNGPGRTPPCLQPRAVAAIVSAS